MNEEVADILLRTEAEPSTFVPIEPSSDILAGDVPGRRAIALWQSLRDAFPRTGVWPIINGEASDQDWMHLGPAGADCRVPQGEIREVLNDLFIEECRQLADLIEGLSPVDGFEGVALKADEAEVNRFLNSLGRPPSPWPSSDVPRPIELGGVLEDCGQGASRQLLESVSLGLVPVHYPYEVPLRLNYGGWNFRPEPGLNAAVLREWGKSHGAVPVCMYGAVMECMVDRPPMTERESMSLAAEQWIYCNDIVMQGTYSIRDLAIALWRSPTWYFWWD